MSQLTLHHAVIEALKKLRYPSLIVCVQALKVVHIIDDTPCVASYQIYDQQKYLLSTSDQTQCKERKDRIQAYLSVALHCIVTSDCRDFSVAPMDMK